MKYNIIKITPTFSDWGLNVFLDQSDRDLIETKPNPRGFYYLPETESIKIGVEDLKEVMINSHEKEIKRLKLSLKKLKEVSYEK